MKGLASNKNENEEEEEACVVEDRYNTPLLCLYICVTMLDMCYIMNNTFLPFISICFSSQHPNLLGNESTHAAFSFFILLLLCLNMCKYMGSHTRGYTFIRYLMKEE